MDPLDTSTPPPQRPRVLIVDDEANLPIFLKDFLEECGFDVSMAVTGKSALRVALENPPDAIILDVDLPDTDGYTLCRAMRRTSTLRTVPIVMLTARSDEADVVTALALGADDYVRKPFGLAELLARVAAILRRWGASTRAEATKPMLGPWTLDLGNLRARSGPVEVTLTNLEAEILSLLLARPGEVYRREEVLERIWGVTSAHLTRTLDNHVARLRKKLEVEPQNPRLILTVHGIGYRTA